MEPHPLHALTAHLRSINAPAPGALVYALDDRRRIVLYVVRDGVIGRPIVTIEMPLNLATEFQLRAPNGEKVLRALDFSEPETGDVWTLPVVSLQEA